MNVIIIIRGVVMLKLNKISKSYSIDKNDKISLLNDISLEISNNKFYNYLLKHPFPMNSLIKESIGMLDVSIGKKLLRYSYNLLDSA